MYTTNKKWGEVKKHITVWKTRDNKQNFKG